MKFAKSLACALVALTVGGAAFADSDDAKWIERCIKDNKNEGAKPDVVRKYCTCMNGKMEDSETRTITQWEQANPAAMKACEKEAGWK